MNPDAPASYRSDAGVKPPPRSGLRLPGTIALLLLALGGLNWGLIGLFDLDAVAWLLGPHSIAARVVYVAVGLAAAYCLARLPRWSRAG